MKSATVEFRSSRRFHEAGNAGYDNRIQVIRPVETIAVAAGTTIQAIMTIAPGKTVIARTAGQAASQSIRIPEQVVAALRFIAPFY